MTPKRTTGQRAIFITVRSASTRLPNKCFLPIAGKMTIEWLIERVKKSQLAEVIVMTTTTFKEDDRLESIAKSMGIECFRGSVKDKLERWRGACEKFNVSVFATADGDDLFCDPSLLDRALVQLDEEDLDFIYTDEIACGAFSFAVRASALRKVCEMKDTDDTEMMWVYFTQTGKFKIGALNNYPTHFNRSDVRMTLDYQEDFDFFRAVLEPNAKNDMNSLDAILNYLDKNPHIIEINRHLHKVWKMNQESKTKLLLKGNA